MNTPCIHCDAGCAIHETKPRECSDFDCAYLSLRTENVELRPDNCGIVFEKLNDDIIFGTVHKEPTEMAKRQVGSFVSQGFSVVLSSLSEMKNGFFISKRHDEETIRRDFYTIVLRKYGYLRNGSNNTQ